MEKESDDFEKACDKAEFCEVLWFDSQFKNESENDHVLAQLNEMGFRVQKIESIE